ncbi:TonB-dependent receptor [Algoriphagus sp. NG3]|uniref:SusC/RagA family TonB-linked outer membrane protein n=1 Tax=Algoriphagus sp. NG3 TaxID=3097546 RepID=UPI002A82DA19|nr:TonB-dependent receptor [Algoriphagus sp. NG3]WPR73835.1 TonB-dependent receptor [Algoriphagus sp. NG3]
MNFKNLLNMHRHLHQKFLMLLFCGTITTVPSLAESTTAEEIANGYTEDFRIPQAVNVSGTVTSGGDNLPLPGVNVVIKGTTTGVVTDLEGKYSLSVSDGNVVLVFSTIGFVTQEITVGSQSIINVTLHEDLQNLDEVMVIGYGTQEKSDVTGAISSISADQIKATPLQNPMQALQGRAAGVDISTNARPGEVGPIRIRGVRTIAGGNSPLFVVDGVPLISGGIESINPNDIESMEVLKDASATAIYGSRGANGVVLISTRKGKNGRTQLNFDASVNFDQLDNIAEYFNASEFAAYRRDAARAISGSNQYSTPYPNPGDDFRYFGTDPSAWETIAAGYSWADKENLVANMRPTTAEEQAMWGVSEVPIYNPGNIRTTPWTDYVERTGVTQNYSLSATMGNEKVKAFLSGGMLDQLGVTDDQDYKRYNALANVEIQAVDWLTLGGSLNVSYSVQNYGYSAGGSRGSRTLYEASLGQLPFAVPYDEAGNYIFNPGGNPNIINPIRDADYVINERTTLRAFGSLFAEARLAKGLRFRTIFGPDIRNYRSGQFQAAESSLRGGGSSSSTNYARLGQSQNLAWTWENLLFYDFNVGTDHQFGLTFLQSSSMQRSESSDMTASDLPYDSQLWYNLGSTNRGALDGWGSGFSKRSLLSYMARLNYSFKNKYLLTMTGRADGASVLSSGNKWDFFPSFSAGWKLEEEGFLQAQSWLNQLKLRIGYGTVGNQSVSPYSTAGGLVQLPYQFGSEPAIGYVTSNPKGSSQGALPNKNLGWEKTSTLNIGLDFGILNDRISGSLEYYDASTYDLLLNKTPNSVTGYSSITVNAGETRNRGFELSVNSVNIQKSNFQWSSTINFSTNKNEIVNLANGPIDDINNRWFIGQPISVFYDFRKIGIWQESDADLMAQYNENGASYKAGDIRVEDVNGDMKIDANSDRVILGTSNPKWTSGLVNTFRFHNFELSAFIYARWGYMVQGGAVELSGQYASRKVDYWTPTNPSTTYPRADFSNGGQPIHYSTMNYQDGSFIKIRYISLSYNFGDKTLNRLNMSNLRVYTQVLNPYFYSKTDFLDPDSSFQIGGANPSASSITTRSFVLGLNVSF